MKRYTISHIPVMAFFSKDLYADMGLNWKGVAFGYLLLLLAICWIPGMFEINSAVSKFVDDEAGKMISQVPTLSIVNGQASIKEPQPYYIKDPDTGKPLVIIDTTGAITSLDGNDAVMLITKTKAIFKKSNVETRTFDFSQIKEFTIDQQKITDWLNMGKKILIPILYPMCVLGSFASRIIQVLIYAAIGMLFASSFKSRVSYGGLVRLAVAAITPCIIIKTLVGITQIALPLAGLWYFLIAMAYLYFGVKAVAQEENMMQQENSTPESN
jgi:hypothetical protein